MKVLLIFFGLVLYGGISCLLGLFLGVAFAIEKKQDEIEQRLRQKEDGDHGNPP